MDHSADRLSAGRAHHHLGAGSTGAGGTGAVDPEQRPDLLRRGRRGAVPDAGAAAHPAGRQAPHAAAGVLRGGDRALLRRARGLPRRGVRRRRRDDGADDRAVHSVLRRRHLRHPQRQQGAGGQLRPDLAVLRRPDPRRAGAEPYLQRGRRGLHRRRRAELHRHGGAATAVHAVAADLPRRDRPRVAADHGVFRRFSGHGPAPRQKDAASHRRRAAVYICRAGAVPHGRQRRLHAGGHLPRRDAGESVVPLDHHSCGHADRLLHRQGGACGLRPDEAGGGVDQRRDLRLCFAEKPVDRRRRVDRFGDDPRAQRYFHSLSHHPRLCAGAGVELCRAGYLHRHCV